MHSNPLTTLQTRLAGAFYVVIILCGVGSEVALRGPLIDPLSAADTARAILSEVGRFRLSILADVVMALADVALAILLFGMFRSVSKTLSLAALTFRLVQAAVIAANLLNLQMALLLAQADAADLALGHIQLHAFGYDLGLFFFAMNCLATAVLIWRSGFVPRWIGFGIAASGAVYLTGSLIRFLAPELTPAIAPAYAVPLIAETAFCLWLLLAPNTRAAKA